MKWWLVLAAAGLLALAAWGGGGRPAREQVRGLATHTPTETALMRQRAAEAKAKKRKARASQITIPLSHVSRHLIQAVVSSEDQKFFGHEGIDWQALKESAEANVKKRRAARGGSTLTQQLAKNLYFGTEKSLLRKAREAVVTAWLEDDLSKARILALYLNLIEWGDGIYGCEAAARAWFGKPCSDLTVEEAAGLAGMIPNPRRINPQVSPERYERARKRVLWLMARAGYLEKSVAGLGTAPPPPPEPDPLEEEEPEPLREEAPAAPASPPTGSP